jgi:hypothetical protein
MPDRAQRAKGAAEEAKGKAKKETGRVTRNRSQEAAGGAEKTRRPRDRRSAPDAVVHVGDPVALEDPGALELDLLGSEVVEQPTALAEQHRDEMDLELV